MKYDDIRKVINSLSGLYNDKRLGPMLKLSLLKYMRELTKQMQDLACIINKMYLDYAIKDNQGNIITHEFKMEYAMEKTFKDKDKNIIFIPITNDKEQYSIEMLYSDYTMAHDEALKFMDNEYQVSNVFKMSIDEAIKYNLSAQEIDYLEEIKIIYDNSSNNKIIVPKIIK